MGDGSNGRHRIPDLRHWERIDSARRDYIILAPAQTMRLRGSAEVARRAQQKSMRLDQPSDIGPGEQLPESVGLNGLAFAAPLGLSLVPS
jgi:hypothetical protein